MKWFKNCILIASTWANQNPYFEITDAKLYVPAVALSTQNNTKFIKQLQFGFNKTINWGKYLPRGILVKGTTTKITSQDGRFFKFLRPLLTAGLLLMKSVLPPLAKNLLLLFGSSAAMSETDATL